jgi:hypothetical protein
MVRTLRMGRRQLCNRLHTALLSKLFRLRYSEKKGGVRPTLVGYMRIKHPPEYKDIGRVSHEAQDQ